MGICSSKGDKEEYSKKVLTEKTKDEESRKESLMPENLDVKSYDKSSLQLQDREEAVIDTTDKPLQSSAGEERGGNESIHSLSDRSEVVSSTTEKSHFDSRSRKKSSWEYPDRNETVSDTTYKPLFDSSSREESSLEFPGRSEGVSGTTEKALQSSTAECSTQPNGNGANKSLSGKFLRRIAAEIGKEWYLLSLSLGVTNAELDRIEYDRGHDTETKIVKALLKWRSQSSHLSAHSQLKQLLAELQENGRQDLADKYREYLDRSEVVSSTTEKSHFDSRSRKKSSWEYPDRNETVSDTTYKPLFDSSSREESSLEFPGRSEGVSGTTEKALQSSTAECSTQPNGNGANKSLSGKFLRRIAAEIGKEWYLLSLSLGVTNAELDRIEYDRGHETETKIVKALLKWRSQSSHLSAHSQLKQLLAELQENGRQDLADKYREYLEKPLLTQVSVENESEIEEDEKIRTLREQLYIFNEKETQRVPVSPFQKSATLSIDEIYAPVYIKEDLKYTEKGRNIGRTFKPQKKSKLVKGPDDIFYINKEKGEMVGNVFMLGDAGHGKTVFCQQLLKKWCSAREKVKASKNVHQLDKWEELLLQFDYLFHVQLRHVGEGRTSLIDMICHDVFERHPDCHMTIRKVVSSRIQKCLVVVDGLDEWKISKEEKRKLKFDGLPNLDGMGNSTIFWTSRPWKFDDIIETLRSRDRVLEIHGLEEKGIEVVTDKVLANFYDLDMASMEYKSLKNDLLQKLGDEQLKDLMKIPLIAIAGIQIWTEKKRVTKSMTAFFIALTDMLIGRALKKKDISEKASGIDELSSNERTSIWKRFEESDYAVDYLPLLEKLGEIAYNDLISNEKNLVFKKRYLERNLGKHTVEFALKVGLLSQCEAPGCFSEENISINFFHKSMQEFMAAIHVASGKVSGDSLCSSLTDFQVIFELGNIVKFLSGLDPSIGTLISQHIAGLADSDKDVTEYRQGWIKSDDNKIRLLYKLQLSCFREIRFAQTILKSEEVAMVKPVITDVLVDKNSDKDIIHTTLDILVNHPSTIKSLNIDDVSNHGKDGITDQVLLNTLDNAVSLQSLCISGVGTYRCLHKVGDIFYSLKCLVLYNVDITWDVLFSLTTILSSNKILKSLELSGIKIKDNEEKKEEGQLAPLSGVIQTLPSIQQLTSLWIGLYSKEEKLLFIEVLPELLCLEHFHYEGYPEHDSDDVYDDDDYDALIVCAAATECPMLRTLLCYNIHMDHIPLSSNDSMSEIEEIYFVKITMSEEGWEEFILSLMNVQSNVKVALHDTDITVENQMMIVSLPHFEITKNEVSEDGETVFEFTKPTTSNVYHRILF